MLSSFYLGDVVSYDLHLVLITKMCDMTYLILYSTQGDVFMLAEIVFQSSCTDVSPTLTLLDAFAAAGVAKTEDVRTTKHVERGTQMGICIRS